MTVPETPLPLDARTATVPERSRLRGGRPPNALAGEVEERLLDAATLVFLERGYEGATFEQIADAARAGKATIYARYSGKEALFTAVIRRSVERTMRFVEDVPTDLPLRDRLSISGQRILDRALSVEVISLMRVVAGVAGRFPIHARLADENGRGRAIKAVARVIAAGNTTGPRTAMTEPSHQAIEAARHFIDMIFAPMILRALMGVDIELLRMEAPAQIAYTIAVATDPSGAIFGIRDN